jgi:hypothetical protein
LAITEPSLYFPVQALNLYLTREAYGSTIVFVQS